MTPRPPFERRSYQPDRNTRCVSGRHVWTDPADAAKCCHPDWRRELRVGRFDGRPWFAHVWMPVRRPANEP